MEVPNLVILSLLSLNKSILITECVRPVPFRHTLRKQEVALWKWSGSKSHNKVSVGEPTKGSRLQLQKESPKSLIGLFESRLFIFKCHWHNVNDPYPDLATQTIKLSN